MARHAAIKCLAMGLAMAVASGATSNAADFYKDKTIVIVTSTGEGGGYDLIARSFTRHMPKHIPGNPNIIVQNMPGGGHMLATNHLYNVAPKDGTVIGTVNQNVPSHQILDGRGVRYDAGKFNWLGALENLNATIAVWHTHGIKSIEDAKTREIITGATGDGSSAFRYPLIMNTVLGTKFKIIKGYKNTGDIYTAMERGEIQARGGGYQSFRVQRPDWIRDGKVNFIVQIGRQREAAIPDVPLWSEVATTDEQREVLRLIAAPMSVGRPFLAPPGLPEERVAILRSAFNATVRDPGFISDGEKLNFETGLITAEELTKVVIDTISVPPEIIAKAKDAMGEGGGTDK